MKNYSLLIAIFISSSVVKLQVTVQDVAGTYERKIFTTNPSIFNYTLNLNASGTFQFHAYDKIPGGIPPERNKYAKGTWSLQKKVVYFYTSTSDFDERFTLDFNTSKIFWIESLYISKVQ